MLARLEDELDRAYNGVRATSQESDETIAEAISVLDDVIDRIHAVPSETLGALRLQAKAVVRRGYDVNCDAGMVDLLMVLAALPHRLWNERIGP